MCRPLGSLSNDDDAAVEKFLSQSESKQVFAELSKTFRPYALCWRFLMSLLTIANKKYSSRCDYYSLILLQIVNVLRVKLTLSVVMKTDFSRYQLMKSQTAWFSISPLYDETIKLGKRKLKNSVSSCNTGYKTT